MADVAFTSASVDSSGGSVTTVWAASMAGAGAVTGAVLRIGGEVIPLTYVTDSDGQFTTGRTIRKDENAVIDVPRDVMQDGSANSNALVNGGAITNSSTSLRPAPIPSRAGPRNDERDRSNSRVERMRR